MKIRWFTHSSRYDTINRLIKSGRHLVSLMYFCLFYYNIFSGIILEKSSNYQSSYISAMPNFMIPYLVCILMILRGQLLMILMNKQRCATETLEKWNTYIFKLRFTNCNSKNSTSYHFHGNLVNKYKFHMIETDSKSE